MILSAPISSNLIGAEGGPGRPGQHKDTSLLQEQVCYVHIKGCFYNETLPSHISNLGLQVIWFTKNVEPYLLGGFAQTVGGGECVEARVGTFALLDQQRAAVVRHHLVDVLVVLNFHPAVGLVRRSFVPGEGGERTPPYFGHYGNVGALFHLHELLQLNRGGTCRGTANRSLKAAV